MQLVVQRVCYVRAMRKQRKQSAIESYKTSDQIESFLFRIFLLTFDMEL